MSDIEPAEPPTSAVPAVPTVTSPARASVRPPRRGRTPRRWLIVLGAAALVLLYTVVIVLYSASGRVKPTGEDENPDPGGVTVALTPQTVNASGESISMLLTINASSQLETKDGISLADELTVIITPVSGEQTLVFGKNAIPGTKTVTVLTSGAVEEWPFDSYDAGMVIVAYLTKDGIDHPLDTKVFMSGYLPGWSIDPHIEPVAVDSSGDTPPIPVIALSATRSWSTIAFGILLLALLVVMPALVLFVAITTFRGKRKVEATLTSWMGAMLFATIPLRSFLPGSPPIGSWIDFVVVLWVIMGLIAGLIIYIAAWMRWGTPAVKPPT